MEKIFNREVTFHAGPEKLKGILDLPYGAKGLVLFAHGTGSGRLSPRNRYVADKLNESGLGTLLFDLLTEDEERLEESGGELRFNIDLLAGRLLDASACVRQHNYAADLRYGYFGASTGAAAALKAAALEPDGVDAVVSRGGRPDLANESLLSVRAPTLLIVGGRDPVVLDLNRQAYDLLRTEKELEIVPGATHLFEEPGALDEVVLLARAWFLEYLTLAKREKKAA
jgi:putative phosphoribosyl transferase